MLPALLKEKGEGEAAGFAGAPEKLKVGLADSAVVISAPVPEADRSCFFESA